MSSKSNARKKEASDCNDSNSVSSKPDRKKQPRIRWEDISSKNNTTNETSSPSATDSSAAAKLPASLPGLPTFAAAAAAAAPKRKDPPVKKKPRRAGFREQFLQQLRAMLDRESQNNSTIVQWAADGNSFIIMDQLEFEEHIIPTYFDNPIMLSSFLSKLSRWGFRRIPNIRSEYYEFCQPTFKRLGVDSAPASAAARGGDSIQIQQPQIQRVMDRINSHPAPNQSNLSLSHSIADLISNIQRQRSSQQPSMSRQQPVLNQDIDANSNLQSFQQWHHSNPTMNTLNTNSSSHLIGRQIANFFSSLPQNSAMSHSGLLPNRNTTPFMPQSNNIAVLHSLATMQRAVEEELQHRKRVDHILNTMLSMLGQIISDRGRLLNDNIVQSQQGQGMIPPLTQSLGSNNNYQVGASLPSISNLNDQADSIAAILQATGWGASTPSSGGIQADLIAAILQSARTSEPAVPAGHPEEHARARTEVGNDDNGDDDDDEVGGVDRHLSARKGESPDDDHSYDADDDSWEKTIGPRNTARKKSPRK